MSYKEAQKKYAKIGIDTEAGGLAGICLCIRIMAVMGTRIIGG